MNRNEIPVHATVWTNLGNCTLLHERSQTQKATYYRVTFTWKVQNGPIYGDSKWRSGCQGLRGAKIRGQWLEGMGFLSGGKNVLKLMVVTSAPICEYTKSKAWVNCVGCEFLFYKAVTKKQNKINVY